jgi:hypothetical protein
MPRATVAAEPKRFDLKSCPPDGYVLIREMSYGERMVRNAKQGKMKVLKKNADHIGEVEMALAELSKWDMSNLVVEHNLQDDDGQLLDLSSDRDLRKLSSRIGEEIGKYIDELNNFDDEEDGKGN